MKVPIRRIAFAKNSGSSRSHAGGGASLLRRDEFSRSRQQRGLWPWPETEEHPCWFGLMVHPLVSCSKHATEAGDLKLSCGNAGTWQTWVASCSSGSTNTKSKIRASQLVLDI